MSKAHVFFLRLLRRGHGLPRRVLSKTRPGLALTAGFAALIAAFLPACSDKDRLLNGREAQDYKLQLVRDHPGELTTSQVERLGRYMGRTKVGIDQLFGQFLAENAAAAARERKEWEKARKAGPEKAPP